LVENSALLFLVCSSCLNTAMAPQPPTRIPLPSTIDEFVSLRKSSERMTESMKKHHQQISNYVRSSLTIGRHLNRAVILTLGVSGHGKSKTINTLVGREILLVAKRSDGSTTEVCILMSS
jgi:ribosome biogenesis GTPase A